MAVLLSLHIENLAVVKCVDLELSAGFTVLTGETGAGKSMILDAIHLLLGEKPQMEMIRTGEDHAAVSALFADLGGETTAQLAEFGVSPDEDGNLYLERTVFSDGRAQTRLNGRIIPASLQREIGALLVNIHGQHDAYALLQPAKHLGFLDAYAKDLALLEAYGACYRSMQETAKELEALRRQTTEKEERLERLGARVKEIDAAKLKAGEEALLISTRQKIKSTEKVAKQANTVYRALAANEKGAAVADLLQIAAQALKQMEGVLPDALALAEQLEEQREKCIDLAESALNAASSGFDNPEVLLDKIESRLSLLQRLKRRYGDTVEEILENRDRSYAELKLLEEAEEKESALMAELAKRTKLAEAAAARLSARRKEAAAELASHILEELSFLDLTKVRFEAALTPAPLSPDGAEKVEFLIATGPGEPLRPLAKIASGGELSRIMLAIKSVLAESDAVGTLVFDEVDTGISGKTSQKVGIKLRHTAKDCQVLCVTHAAQIAALANTHFLIRKQEVDGRNETSVLLLGDEERIDELSRIMGGMELTDTLRRSARELFETSQRL